MCKVAGVTKINNKNRDEVWLFMQILGDYMSIGNDHGLGYAAFDGQGKLFGERWLYNRSAFTDLSTQRGLSAEKMAKIYSFFGNKVLRDEARAIILHTRYATCAKNIENTHPFVDNIDDPSVAIIHNGMISNDDEFVKKYSTCDSEVLAHLYKKHGVSGKLKNLNKFAKQLDGWFTVLNLATDADRKPVMDIYTMNGRLTSFFVPALDTRVYCTDGRNIEATAQFMGMELTDAQDTRAYRAYRVDVGTGEVVDRIELAKPRPRFTEVVDGWGNNNNIFRATGDMSDPDFREAFFRGLDGASQNWRE